VWHRPRLENMWGPWTDLGRPNGVEIIAPAAAVAPGPNELHVAVLGLDDRLYYQSFNGTTWSGWNDIGGDVVDPPWIVAEPRPESTVIHIVVRGRFSLSEPHFYHQAFDGVLG
jgi:hypothetical protein